MIEASDPRGETREDGEAQVLVATGGRSDCYHRPIGDDPSPRCGGHAEASYTLRELRHARVFKDPCANCYPGHEA